MKCQLSSLRFFILLFVFLLSACTDKPLNNPYSDADKTANIYYSSFTEQPKTLDPARSYSSDEAIFVAQIYEPPLQYHYLLRPYTLVPLTATAMPKLIYLDKAGKSLPATAAPKDIAYSVYEIRIKPNIYYQPHPAFARTTKGKGDYRYHHLTQIELSNIHKLSDFKQTGTRELIADDYVYEVKRLMSPKVVSPIFGFLSHYRVDAKVVDRYTYQITLKGFYPQFIYWLAMPFFAPIPWEADKFYSQPGMAEKNITLDWYPVGTGPYLLEENNPNRQMVLARNPNFHGERYPSSALRAPSPTRGEGDLNTLADQRLPFVDKFIFTLEKETIPRWTKFLQGYYDQSGISSDSFDQAIRVDANGNPIVTPTLKEKEIYLQTETAANDFYWGFNMLDPIVGGDSERARKLRQAIALAIDTEEFISIFLNGRGIPAQSPIPPGIFGYQSGQAGLNPYIYNWEHNNAVRKDIALAKQLLAEAGYPNGRDPKTGKPLLLNYDLASGGTGDDKAMLSWMREEFAKLGIDLQIRGTQYNRFQEIVRTGQAQIYLWGWNADYPDPENFLFLLYGPNGKVKSGGENASNYQNPEYDKLFEQMRDMPNGPERQVVINKMLQIIWRDTPWVWGFHPKSFVLAQSWVTPSKPNVIANNTLKYIKLDPAKRAMKRAEWNQPIWWPLWTFLIVLLLSFIPVFIYYRRHLHK